MTDLLNYNYSFSEKRYWRPLKEATDADALQFQEPEETAGNTVISYYSDTGQLNSNCFFFVEGSESEVVRNKITDILQTTGLQQTLSDVENIGNQDMVASYVFKYVIQNNTCEFSLMDRCLTYLCGTSKYFMDKIGNGRNGAKRLANSDEVHISRCSYKFCNHTYDCQYNYPEERRGRKSNKGCYSDHFPHSKVYQDIVSLQSYIRKLQKEADSDVLVIRSNQEIIKCINTIAYVIKHMYDELWNIYISCKKDPSYEKLHRNIL